MPETTKTARDSDKALLHAAIVIVFGILATSLAQTQVLAIIPVRNLLKNELHVDRAANAAFFFWLTFPWFLKPIFGIVTDAFPLFGSKMTDTYHVPFSTLVFSNAATTAITIPLVFLLPLYVVRRKDAEVLPEDERALPRIALE